MHGSRLHNIPMRLVLLILTSIILTGCSTVGVATGTGATVGVAAEQEGGIKAAVSDIEIRALINDLWFRYSVSAFSKLRLTVRAGRVLITGVVQNPDERVEAVRLAWQVKGVKEIINEIKVANSEGFQGFVRDEWITTRLRASLTFDREVRSINYSIDTVQGVIYLMGNARSQAELDRVVEIARTISNVRQVVSYVKVPAFVPSVPMSVMATPRHAMPQGKTAPVTQPAMPVYHATPSRSSSSITREVLPP